MRGGIEVDKEKQLLRVLFGPHASVKDWKKALTGVQRLSEETGIRRVLVDVQAQKKTAGTGTLFEFGSHLPLGIAFAILCDLDREDHHFVETIASNRGIPIQDFDSEQEALEWLADWPNASKTPKL